MTDTLYTIPQNWQWFKLGEVCNFERGITFPANAKENKLTEKNIPCIRTANVQSELDITDLIYIDKSYTKNNSAKLLKSGDIIMSSANSRELVGKTCYVKSVNFEMTFGGFVTVIRSENIFSKYIFYFLRYEFLMGKFMSESTQTVNIANINTSTLSNYSCPVPPLAEQKRIVERLDSLFEKLDTAKKILQDIVDGYEIRRAAILHRAFTGKLTEDFRKINNLSLDDWQEKTLGNIADVKGGKRIPKGMRLSQIDTGHPYIKAGNLKKGTVIDEGIMYVPIEIWHYIKRYTVSAGDVYITNVGACIGDCGVIPEKYDGANLTENAVKITKMQCDGKWLSIFLSTNGIQEKIKNLTASATLGKLSIKNIKNLQIPFPSLAEQKEIARRLDSLIGKENQAKEIAENLLSEIETLKKTILARAFRGELGTNDPAENAVENFI